MATFLATGILQDISIPKKHIPNKDITINGIVTSLRQNNIDPTYYNFTEDKESYDWQLKPKILETGLVDFLAAQAPMYWNIKDEEKDMEEVISKIKRCKTGKEIMKFASGDKKHRNFQWISSIGDMTVRSETGFSYRVMIYYGLIAYFLQGKIMMECYSDMFRYFENTIRLQRDKYPIVDCVKVRIVG